MHITVCALSFFQQDSSINIPTTSTSRIRKLVLVRLNYNDKQAAFTKEVWDFAPSPSKSMFFVAWLRSHRQQNGLGCFKYADLGHHFQPAAWVSKSGGPGVQHFKQAPQVILAHVLSRFSCVWLCNPSVPGSSVHGISRQEHWSIAMHSSRGSSGSRDWTCVSCIFCIGRQVLVLYH